MDTTENTNDTETLFSIHNLTFGYQDKNVLNEVNFTINRGEFVCFMGPNGGGKSTLLQMMLGFLKQQSGNIFYKGRNVTEWLNDPQLKREYHQQVGILFQNVDIQLFNSTVYDEIAFGPKQMDIPEEEIENRVNDCLNIFGLNHLKKNVPYHLSGGEKREVALASVLALNPDVILLDEPLVGLTYGNRAKLLRVFGQLNRIGKTIIMITHYFDQVKDLATDYVIFGNHDAQKKTRAQVLEDPELLQIVSEY